MIFPILYIDLILCRKKIIHIPAAPKSLALPPSAIPPPRRVALKPVQPDLIFQDQVITNTFERHGRCPHGKQKENEKTD